MIAVASAGVSTRPPRSLVVPMVAASIALHGLAAVALARSSPAPRSERIELEVVQRQRPPPPPREAPRPPPRPPERRVAAVPPAGPPPPLASAPPPPDAPAPAPAPRAIPKVGISLGSTVGSGGFAVGVGNTAYGRADETAADPASVRPYSARTVPSARLTAQPRVLSIPKIPYPEDARREGIEGEVVLVLRIDASGAVTSVRVVEAPSPALAAAAQEGARSFRFAPALAEGEAVATEIRFQYTFLLE